MQLTSHFSLEEFVRSKDGIPNDPPQEVAANLIRVAEKAEEARGIWTRAMGKDVPVRISYGYRSPALNAAAGGSETSAHMEGLAADLIPKGMDLRMAWDLLRLDLVYMEDVDQLIIERGCIHVGLPTARHDFRPRHELRLDQDVNGVRKYPLFGIWEAPR